MAISLNMLLLDGTAAGPKTAEIGNWPGKAVFSPIQNAADILKRSEFGNPGVYVLKSDPKENYFSERVYVGESENLRDRLKNHLSNVGKKPFHSFVAFTSTGSMLNKATVRYLEHRLIQIATENQTSEVVNKVSPKKPRISEANQHTMEDFLGQMKLILPVLGFEFTRPTTILNAKPELVVVKREFYRLKDPKLKTFMFPNEGQFVVTKGSEAKKSNSPTQSKGNILAKRRLLEQGILIDSGEYLVFTQDTIFSSTSAASSVCLGRASAGPRYWIHIEKEKTYGELIQS